MTPCLRAYVVLPETLSSYPHVVALTPGSDTADLYSRLHSCVHAYTHMQK